MTIQYQFSEQEALRSLLRGKRTSVCRLLLRFSVVVVGVLFILRSYYLPSYHSQTDFSLGYVFIFLGLVLVVFTPLLTRATYAKYVHDNAAMFTEPYQVTASEDGLVFATSKVKSEFLWSVYRKLSEDEQYFYLYGQGQQPMAVLPKQAFDAPALEEFRRLNRSIPRT